MSEFKFACPVCGQHITSTPESSGSQIECPTCFTKLVVPERKAGDSKLIFSATKVQESRPGDNGPEGVKRKRPPRYVLPVAGITFVLALGAAIGGGVWFFKHRAQWHQGRQHAHPTEANHPASLGTNTGWSSPFKVPNKFQWTLNLTNVAIPTNVVAGRLSGQGFKVQRATIQGGTLTLRQGKDWPPDLGLTVVLFAKAPEQLSGKTIFIWPDRQPPVPKVVLRWKDETGKDRTRDVREGYAMCVEFGKPADEKIPGSIYISLPDEKQSFAAGSFLAEIRRPPPRTNVVVKASAPGTKTNAPAPPKTNSTAH